MTKRSGSKKAPAKKPAPKKKPAAKQKRGAKQMPPLETPKHGAGLLYRGGVPGNRGGRHGGSPPSQLRSQLRSDFEARREQLLDIADGTARLRLVGQCEKCGHEGPTVLSTEEIKAALPGVSDRIRAFDVMLKYGLGQAHGLDEQEFEALILDLAESLQQRLRARLADDVTAPLLTQILDDWKRIITARRALRAG